MSEDRFSNFKKIFSDDDDLVSKRAKKRIFIGVVTGHALVLFLPLALMIIAGFYEEKPERVIQVKMIDLSDIENPGGGGNSGGERVIEPDNGVEIPVQEPPSPPLPPTENFVEPDLGGLTQEIENRQRQEAAEREKRLALEQKKQEEAKKAAEAEKQKILLAEQKRKAEEERKKADAEQKRKAEEQRKKADAEQKRKAEEQRKKADAEQKRKAEEQRKKVEAEQKRKADEARRKAEAEQKRKADEARRKAEAERRKREDGIFSGEDSKIVDNRGNNSGNKTGRGDGSGSGEASGAAYVSGLIKYIYNRWDTPEKQMLKDPNAQVKVRIYIAGNGRVSKYEVLSWSKIPAMDDSVRSLLANLTSVPPPPDGKEFIGVFALKILDD